MASQLNRRGAFEFTNVNGRTLKRRADQGDATWVEVKPEAPPEPEHPSYILAVVGVAQSEGEVDHWLIFFGPEAGAGAVFQVTGDAINMQYDHSSNDDVLNSDSFKWAEVIARDVTTASPIIQRLSHLAKCLPPPSAPTQAQVTENCQNWVLRVLTALVNEDLVPPSKLQSIRTRQQPLQL